MTSTTSDFDSHPNPPEGAAADRRMVTLVRESKGWTQRDLATASHLHQSVISKYENGLVELKGSNLTAVAEALECPVELLTSAAPDFGLDATCLHHRRRTSKLSATASKKVEGVAHLIRITVEGLASDTIPAAALPRLSIDSTTPETAAAEIRDLAGQPHGPIENLTDLIERLGVIVVERPLGNTAQDAVSSWPHDTRRPPILVISSGLSGDRLRFTLAHELGHLVLHRMPSDTQEAEADRFAAELLAPAHDIVIDLAGLTTRDTHRLLALKVKWGMSIAALVRRAKDTDIISDRQYREFNIKLSRLGWRTSEPVTVPVEHPTTLPRLISARLALGSMRELARTALMTEQTFQRYYAPHRIAPSLQAEGAPDAR